MIAGSLQFTLGLQANQFLNSLGIASGRLVGFTAAANAVNAVLSKMWAAVQQGGNLRDLAAGAGISVKALYQLQEAFKQVGASADRVPAIMLRLQRTLGTSEGRSALASLGLDPQQLAAADPAAQMERIAQAMAKLNANASGAAAFKLFGREGWMTFRQIASQAGDFSDAMRRAAGDATIWQKVAFEFDNITDKVTEIEGRLKTMWALFTGAAIQAFREGKLSELITDIIVTGFQAAIDIIPALFVKLGEVLIRILTTPLTYMQAYVTKIIEEILEQIGKIPGPNSFRGFQARSFGDIRRQIQEEGPRFNLGTGEFGIQDISAEANRFLRERMKRAGGRFTDLEQKMLELLGRLPQGPGARTSAAGGPAIFGDKLKISDVTNIEKMGGVLFGLGRGFGADHARATANNTKAMLAEQKKTNTLLQGFGGEPMNE